MGHREQQFHVQSVPAKMLRAAPAAKLPLQSPPRLLQYEACSLSKTLKAGNAASLFLRVSYSDAALPAAVCQVG